MDIRFTKPTKQATSVVFTSGKGSCYIENEKEKSLTIKTENLDQLTNRQLILLFRRAVRVAQTQEIKELVCDASMLPNTQESKLSEEEQGRQFAENAILAGYEFQTYKTKEKDQYEGVANIFVTNATAAFKKGATAGAIVAREVNFCRNLANTPGGDMTPRLLANAAQKAAEGTAIQVSILAKKDLQKLKMGLILGVGQGSPEPLQFIVMEYWGAGKKSKEKPIVLAGKGVTFDTGGVNLKPTEGIFGMNQDMAGGSACVAAIAAAAKLGVKKNIITLVPAVENAISGPATRPGDVHTAMNKKTVEIVNTDAEGRLVLADTLTYAEKYAPRLVVDVATLTGASLVAVGKHASVIMTKDEALEKTLRDLGEVSGDYVWPLPLWDEYKNLLRSNIADIANIGTGSSGKIAGCIQGGIFLSHFAEKFPRWAHIDMAPRMGSIPEDNLAHGATGAPVRLLVRLLEEI